MVILGVEVAGNLPFLHQSGAKCPGICDAHIDVLLRGIGVRSKGFHPAIRKEGQHLQGGDAGAVLGVGVVRAPLTIPYHNANALLVLLAVSVEVICDGQDNVLTPFQNFERILKGLPFLS